MIDSKATHAISYGLFVLTTREGEKDCGCIINTAQQISSDPLTMAVTVNKANYTHDMIVKTGVFNVSVLTESTPFEVFKHYGFQSGRDAEKFFGEPLRAENGVAYVGGVSNAVISGKVESVVDCETHSLFIAQVTEAKILSEEKAVTYDYYFANIKPKPQKQEKKGYVCKICGYVYEGEPLPEDFICPLCKHGAEDFEKIS